MSSNERDTLEQVVLPGRGFREPQRTKGQPMKLDRLSFCMGMVFAFAEVVASGVKPLALSPPLETHEFDALEEDIRGTANEFGVCVGEDRDVLTTMLFDPAFTAGKAVFLLASDESVLEEYASLKETRKRIGVQGDVDEETDLARRFGSLLGYSPQVVDELCRKPRFADGGATIPGA